MSLTHRTTMAADAQARVISQYIEKPKFMALIGQLGGNVQQVEDALYALYQAAFLDTATGVWLEYIGSIVGEAREGWDDTHYLNFIKARILANRSSGTVNEVLTIIALVIGAGDPTVAFGYATEFYPASMLVEIAYPDWPTTEALRSRMVRIVGKARPTGVRLLINSTDDDSGGDCFTLGDSGQAQPQISANQGLNDVMPTPVIDDVTMQDTTGGALLGNHTYFYRLSAIDAYGESLASAEVSGLTDAGTNTNQLVIAWTAVPGAVGYRLYGRNTGAELFIIQVGAVISAIDTGLITPAGALPASNTAAGDSGGLFISGDLA